MGAGFKADTTFQEAGWSFRQGLNGIEMKVLQAVVDALPSEARAIADRQIAAIDDVRRYSKGKDVLMYQHKGSHKVAEAAPAFVWQLPESRLAQVIIGSNDEVEHRANVWLVQGQLFSITFGHSPRRLTKNASVESTDFFSTQCERFLHFHNLSRRWHMNM